MKLSLKSLIRHVLLLEMILWSRTSTPFIFIDSHLVIKDLRNSLTLKNPKAIVGALGFIFINRHRHTSMFAHHLLPSRLYLSVLEFHQLSHKLVGHGLVRFCTCPRSGISPCPEDGTDILLYFHIS